MKIRHTTSIIAIAAVLGTAGVAMADTSTSAFDASVSVLSPDQTGFLIGGQVSVGGVGSGALTLSRNTANLMVVGGAQSGLATGGVGADSFIQSGLAFDREITTSGALVGLGSVVSRGEAIAALGSAGAASASTEAGGVRDNVDLTTSNGTAAAESSSQGSLNGSLSTSNTLQLLGTSGLFAGSNGLTVGESNLALAYGAAGVLSDGVTGIDLNSIEYGDSPLEVSGNGAVFGVSSDLTGDDNEISMSVANAGNGSISISTSTGGFFTGGGAAAGSATFNDVNSFFGGLY